MRKKRNRKKVGVSPGSLVLEREQILENSYVIASLFDENLYVKGSLDELYRQWKQGNAKLWVDVRGIHDSELLLNLGEKFNIDPLALEDIQEIHQRTKINLYDQSAFVILKNLEYNQEVGDLEVEQIALFVSDRLMISFQESLEDSFPLIYHRIEKPGSRMRIQNTDYLMYAFLDYIIDKYFVVFDEISNGISQIEEKIYLKNHDDISQEVFKLRNVLLRIRRYIYPLRDDLIKMMRSDNPMIAEQNIKYIRDLEDHIIQIIEMIDNQRELINGLRDLSINQTSLSLNKDMKWLAAVSTISIPILFLTGVYGMNFEYMGELKWKYGYPLWWLTTSCIIISLVIYFKRRKML